MQMHVFRLRSFFCVQGDLLHPLTFLCFLPLLNCSSDTCCCCWFANKMVGVHTTTRVETQEGEEVATVLVVPSAVKEAIAMIESDSPLVAAEGFSKLSHATFNNRTCVCVCWLMWW